MLAQEQHQRIIARINKFLVFGKNSSFEARFDTQIIAATQDHIFRYTSNLTNTGEIELPLQVQDRLTDVTAIAVGIYTIPASYVGNLKDGQNDYPEEWDPEYSVAPNLFELYLFTYEGELIESSHPVIDHRDDIYQITEKPITYEHFVNARQRVIQNHHILDQLVNQLA